MSDNVKKTFFKGRKEEVLYNDLFSKIFDVDMERRITISGLREHPLLKGKVVEEESTQQETGAQTGASIEWEINQMRFIQKIARQVETNNFLSPFLMLGFKFYINKMVLFLLNKDMIKNYRQDKEGHPKLLKVLGEMQSDVGVKMERIINQLKECKEKDPLPHFQDGLNSKYQDFMKFKIGYRNTVGKVYEEVHRKYPENSKLRAELKLKVFLCHIINRVFVGNLNTNLFPHFVAWLKKEKGKVSKFYDFRLIEEWIEN